LRDKVAALQKTGAHLRRILSCAAAYWRYAIKKEKFPGRAKPVEIKKRGAFDFPFSRTVSGAE